MVRLQAQFPKHILAFLPFRFSQKLSYFVFGWPSSSVAIQMIAMKAILAIRKLAGSRVGVRGAGSQSGTAKYF